MEKREELGVESFQFGEEDIQSLMSVVPPPEAGNSFTALLELPPNQAVKLLHSPEETTPTIFPPSVLPAMETDNSLETTSSILPNSTPNHCNLVKQEPLDSDSLHNSSPIQSDPIMTISTKRKEREKKVKPSAKKIKNAANETDAEKLPYVHVRARRGQATDSHSLAERARREKINARMKFLQELVPGCNKISGTAMVLDEIINHVQSLQRQVEFLSMRLAAVHPCIDINLDNIFSSESDPIITISTKRKEREKKVKPSAKKIKNAANETDAEKLPYVHVRARRGQATDSHSLAERARREKINARMKFLQELVPGCNKISGTAMVLDEIINHVQSLQRQVEFLSMRLAAVHPCIDINLDNIFSSESGSLMDCNFGGMVSLSLPLSLDGQMNGNSQQQPQLWQPDGIPPQALWGGGEDVNPNFLTPENSLLSYDSSGNSASLHTHQLKMEI